MARCFSCVTSLLKIATSIAVVGTFLYLRTRLHGTKAENFLYQWTILENHITLLPSQTDRILSYAQTHFWYTFKLFYPRYLCFDYGFICIPTIHAVNDVRNLLPLATYAGIFCLSGYALQYGRISYIIGLAYLIIPLLPALNILFPIGTILAERLLFIPSMGFCFIVAEVLTVDLAGTWHAVGAYSYVRFARVMKMLLQPQQQQQQQSKQQGGKAASRSSGSNNSNSSGSKHPQQGQQYITSISQLPRNTSVGLLALMLCVVVPIIVLGSLRIVTRNIDWQSEASIYRSALDVCPNSVKALNNDAVLSFATNDFSDSLAKIEHSIDLYPGHAHAYLNAGVASNKLGERIKALYFYDTGIRVSAAINKHKQSNAKNYAYKGMLLYDWSQQEPLPEVDRAFIQELVLRHNGNSNGNVIVNQEQEQLESITEAQLIQNIRDRLVDAAEAAMDTAIQYGFDQPSVLHSRASLAIHKHDYHTAIYYLKYAIQFTIESKRNPDVPKQDLIHEPLSYNQLAIAYASIGDNTEAEKAYLAGLQYDPQSCEILSNLGNLYRAVGRYEEARNYFQRCLNARSGSTNIDDFTRLAGIKTTVSSLYHTSPMGAPPAALLNNYGILELDHLNNPQRAILMFQQALNIVRHGGLSYGHDTMLNNFNRAVQASSSK